jgi:hypothetical protein
VSVIEEERAMDASSTDKRIDDLAGQVRRFEVKVDDGFARVDDRFERFEGKVDDRFERFEGKVDDRFERFEGKVDRRFERFEDKIDARFARWDKIVIGGAMSIVGAVIYKILGF